MSDINSYCPMYMYVKYDMSKTVGTFNYILQFGPGI